MGEDRLLKCRPAEHGAFDVDMPIDQPRADVFPIQLYFRLAGVFANADDLSPMDGYVRLFDLIGEDIDDLCVFQHKLCIHFSLCSGDLLFECFCLHKNLPQERL